ncbi:MAG: YdcF family protein [Bacteroidetes bacterium]|nr:YdcF family protein [Bacteroidota bacterium]MBU1114556.1 YdcF family protein [Bacteroidota bacterium]MBU1800473.1 YdcF family protein [Bacteroidota bacterium]
MNKNNSSVLIYLFFVSLLEMILTFLIKYDLNSISIKQFNIFFIGNLLPVCIEVILVILLVAQLFNTKSIFTSHKVILVVLTSISLILLFASYLANKTNYIFPEQYLFNYPFKRVFIGGSLMFSFFIKLYIIMLLINLFFNSSFIVYLKSLFTTLFIVIIAFLTIFVFTTKNGYSALKLKPSKESVGVVLGAAVWKDKPSTLLIGRIKKAEELLRNKRISKIQLTGSNAPGEISEAKAAYNYGLSLGIKKHLMFIEDKTTTTTEQIQFIKETLTRNQNNYSILIISDQFHLTRVLEICNFFDVKAMGVASDYSLKWDKLLYYRLRESIALLFFWLFAI